MQYQVDVHLKFKMVPETLYLTVNLIDRFLEKNQVRRSKLQLVGVAALLVSILVLYLYFLSHATAH
jgi:Co/Zn/Cd efflux system component